MTSQEMNIPNKLASLARSKFRSKFKLTQKDRDYIAAKGLETIKDHAYQFIISRVAAYFPKNEGLIPSFAPFAAKLDCYLNIKFKIILNEKVVKNNDEITAIAVITSIYKKKKYTIFHKMNDKHRIYNLDKEKFNKAIDDIKNEIEDIKKSKL